MWGEPDDKEGECNARLFIGDNHGDGTATMRCALAPNHEGLHREQFDRKGGVVTITWVADERKRCDHGCGQWEHAHRQNVECPSRSLDHSYSSCAFCHPGKEPQTCAACGQIYFYAEGHKRDECSKEPFTCTLCGESGVGQHDWPACHAARERRGVETSNYMEDA